MPEEAIVLAGGLGTRLRTVTGDTPKCMAPVNGIPFIHFIVTALQLRGVERFIFSLGYRHDVITAYLDEMFPALEKVYVVEPELLGTGGAIRNALPATSGSNVLVVNGDTLFNIDLFELAHFHAQVGAACTLALKQMVDFDRYGAVDIDAAGRVLAFHEKRFCKSGYINGGVYVIDVKCFSAIAPAGVFSFEAFLADHRPNFALFGRPFQNYFIDIGIPEDYGRFQDDYINATRHRDGSVNGAPVSPAQMFLHSLT